LGKKKKSGAIDREFLRRKGKGSLKKGERGEEKSEYRITRKSQAETARK